MKSRSSSLIIILSLLTSYILCAVDYTAEIQPIFTANCTSCHGGNGSLFLDTYAHVMAGGGSGEVIISGNSANSYLWQRVNNGEMPPGSNPDLSSAEVSLIAQWINEGANEASLSIISESSLYPHELSIIRNFPNPFNPTTRITYGLPVNSDVQVIVYDISGKQIQSLLNDFQSPGYHSINWDASSYPSGMYFAEIKAGKYVRTKKLMLIK